MMRYLRQAIRSYSGLLLAGAVLFQVNFLPAQGIPIAVLDFDGFGISQMEAIALTNRLRNELFRLGTFDVVDRGMMENILNEQDFQMVGCTSNECLVEVGRLLGAKQMMGGSISKVGNTFSVSARLVDVETGRLLAVSDYDLKAEIDDMLTRGMQIVALMLSGDDAGAQALAAQQTFQPGQPVAGPRSTAAQQGQLGGPVRPAATKPRRWQSRIGVWGNSFSLPFSYDLPSELNLWGTQFQPVVSGGYLYRSYYDWEYDDYNSWEDLLYGMLEVHKKWSSSGGNLGASVYSGIGLGYGYYQNEGEDYGSDEIVSFIFTVGAQARAKLLPMLPSLVGDVRIVVTPNYGASIVLSFGGQGSFLQLASIWGSIFIIAAEGGW